MRRALVAALALSVLVVAACANEVDPEPPSGALRKLQGVWKGRGVLVQGKERATVTTYTFDKGKVVYTFGAKGAPREMTVTPDKKRKDLIEMKPKEGRAVSYFFEIKKGVLYLTPVRPDDADPKPDFSGNTSPVLILEREKK